jgi:Ohr subfamily peroxiredoxin
MTTMPTTLQKALYTAKARTTGGRDGHSRTDDGLLDVKLAIPREMGGEGGGTNPEQLFAAGYSACFMSAMKRVAARKKIALPPDSFIDANISIGPLPHGFGLAAQLVIHLPGIDRPLAEEVIAETHKVCPYSNATRGNIDVDLVLAE